MVGLWACFIGDQNPQLELAVLVDRNLTSFWSSSQLLALTKSLGDELVTQNDTTIIINRK